MPLDSIDSIQRRRAVELPGKKLIARRATRLPRVFREKPEFRFQTSHFKGHFATVYVELIPH